MNTYRDEFINKLESLTKQEVKKIEWIYGLGENQGDSSVLYYFDVCLQVSLYNDGQGYISLSADSFCDDRDDCIGTMTGMLEESGSNIGDLSSKVDSDRVVELLRDYLYTYADTKEKPEQDLVYFESM